MQLTEILHAITNADFKMLDEKIIEQPTDFTLLTEKYTKAAIEFIKNSAHEQKKHFFFTWVITKLTILNWPNSNSS